MAKAVFYGQTVVTFLFKYSIAPFLICRSKIVSRLQYAPVVIKYKESNTREDELFKCKICSFTLKAKFNHKQHIQNIYEGSQETKVPDKI